MSSFISVLGLGGSSEDDALQRLLGKPAPPATTPGTAPGAPATRDAMQEALSKVRSAESADFNERSLASPPSPTAQTEHAPASAPSRSRNKAPAATTPKVSISTRDGAKALRAPASSATVPPPAAEKVTASFRADNPTDVDTLAPLPELVHPKLRRPLTETLRITELTRIQKLCWRSALDRDKDVLVRSETGSGKTLAYALPTLHQLLSDCDTSPIDRNVGTLMIVMCPTRELVLQVTDTLSSLLRCAQFITVGGIHGGENRHKEKARLRKGLQVLVTTPGRLLDHLKTTNSFNVLKLRTVIMDEADRLLDMGFEKPIRDIMTLLRDKCEAPEALKRMLVSATITDGVERLSHFALRSNVARIGETEDTFTIPAKLQQHYVSVPVKHRLAILLSFLRSQTDAGSHKIVVFVSTADSAEFLYFLTSRLTSPFTANYRAYEGKAESRPASGMSTKRMVEMANRHIGTNSDRVITFDDDDVEVNPHPDSEMDEDAGQARPPASLASKNAFINVNVFKLHGNMTQVDRSSVFNAFKTSAEKGILFCTDVAARGLDMPRIDWIVHYDPPTDPTNYIHRVGRTARIGNSGDSLMFLSPHEVGYVEYITNFINAQGVQKDGTAQTGQQMISEKKYETFLYYLSKLDPQKSHMWAQSMATLERTICHTVARRTTPAGEQESAKDSLMHISLFAYQSYIRAYSAMPREVKRFFPAAELHLGHVAQSFGIDKSPADVQRQLKGLIREDRVLARDNRKGAVSGTNERKRQRVELEHDDRYHSMLAQKQRKITRDWAEKRRSESTKIKPLQFSEFDA